MSIVDSTEGFGLEIARRRRGLGITLEQLAKRSGLTANFIGMVEHGLSNPSISTAICLAKGLGVEPRELFRTERKMSARAAEAGRLNEKASPAVQGAVLTILQSMRKKRPRRRRLTRST